MIEMRRLKNVVIFIQTILSFVLSRKIINIYNNIARKYGNVTVKDFLRLVLHMGLVPMQTYKPYWSQDRLYQNKLFKSVMTRDRFTSVMRFLNFGEEPNNEDNRLGKIRFLINHLNTIFAEIFTPH